MIYKYEHICPKAKIISTTILMFSILAVIFLFIFYKDLQPVQFLLFFPISIFIVLYFNKINCIIDTDKQILTFQSFYFGLNKSHYKIDDISTIEVFWNKKNNKIIK